MKYLITRKQQEQLLEKLSDWLEPDQFHESHIYSMYLDTPQQDLMRICLDKPAFRQKVRIRSYAPAIHADDPLFLENKKKTKGICHKIRSEFTLESLQDFLKDPKGTDHATRELAHLLRRYDLQPQYSLFAHRFSWIWKERPDLRMTFDDVLTFRTTQPGLFRSEEDRPLLGDDQVILEIKCASGLPLVLSRALFELSIQPASFSKAGQAYRQTLEMKQRTERKQNSHGNISQQHLSAAAAGI